jgi:hypothetical protein
MALLVGALFPSFAAAQVDLPPLPKLGGGDGASGTTIVVRKASGGDSKSSEQVYKKVMKDGKVVEESGDKALAENLLRSADADALLQELLSGQPDCDRMQKMLDEAMQEAMKGAGTLPSDPSLSRDSKSASSSSSKSASSHSESHSSSSSKKSSSDRSSSGATRSGNGTPKNERGDRRAPTARKDPPRTTHPPRSPALGRFTGRATPAPGGAVRRS